LKRLTLWIKKKDVDEPEKQIVLPVKGLEDLMTKEFGTAPVKVTKMSEAISAFNTEDLDEVLALNEIVTYIDKYDDADGSMWDSLLAIQESTGYDVLGAFRVLVNGKFEFFQGENEMEQVAAYLVMQGRVFESKVSAEVRHFLDYKKIGENLLKNGDFFVTTKGIIWFQRDTIDAR
jgi:hypothetical protein